MIMSKKRIITKSNKIISFDLYDTLVNRMTSGPSGVFDLLEKRFEETYGKKLEGFKEKRISSETELRKEGTICLNLSMIYERISGISKEDKEKCILLEQEIEYDISYPNAAGFFLYRKFREKGKEIIVISDMYLEKELLLRILKKCGYDIKKIFISNLEGQSKANGGKLFLKVCEELEIAPKDLLHIGDNIKSDYFFAKRNQIKAKFLKNSKKESPLDRYLQNTKYFYADEDEQIGYSYFGAVTLGFVIWLREMCKKKKITGLYFFSREGFFYKKLFDLLFGAEIKTEYLYVSRKSLSIPLLHFCKSFQDFNKIIYINSPNMTIEQFFQKLGIDEDKIFRDKVLAQLGINKNDTVSYIRNKELFFRLIKDKVDVISKEQFKYISNYLCTNITEKNNNIGIVDIGWTGAMQNNFTTILKENGIQNNYIGLFMGQKEEIETYLKEGMSNYGYLFGYQNRRVREIITSGCGILEFIYHTDHGTTIGYNEQGPILGEIGMTPDTIAHLKAVQKGILQFAEQTAEIQKKYTVFSFENIRKQILHLFQNPNLTMLDRIGEWQVDREDGKIAPRTSVFPVRKFYKELIHSAWQVGFLKRNLKIRAPYFEMVCLARRIRKRWIRYKNASEKR